MILNFFTSGILMYAARCVLIEEGVAMVHGLFNLKLVPPVVNSLEVQIG